MNVISRLLIVTFFLSACASGRLKYVPSGEHVDVHRETLKNERDERLLEETDHQLLVEESIERTFADSSVESVTKRKSDLAQRILSQLEQEDPIAYRKMNAFYEKVAHQDPDNVTEQDEDDSEGGRVLLIIALIMAIISLLFLLRANTVSTADSSPEGCAAAVASVVIFTIFAILFGIVAVVLLVIGLIVLAASSDQKNN